MPDNCSDCGNPMFIAEARKNHPFICPVCVNKWVVRLNDEAYRSHMLARRSGYVTIDALQTERRHVEALQTEVRRLQRRDENASKLFWNMEKVIADQRTQIKDLEPFRPLVEEYVRIADLICPYKPGEKVPSTEAWMKLEEELNGVVDRMRDCASTEDAPPEKPEVTP